MALRGRVCDVSQEAVPLPRPGPAAWAWWELGWTPRGPGLRAPLSSPQEEILGVLVPG